MHLHCPCCHKALTLSKNLLFACLTCGLLFAPHLDEPPKTVMHLGTPPITMEHSISASLSFNLSLPPER